MKSLNPSLVSICIKQISLQASASENIEFHLEISNHELWQDSRGSHDTLDASVDTDDTLEASVDTEDWSAPVVGPHWPGLVSGEQWTTIMVALVTSHTTGPEYSRKKVINHI